MLRTRLITAIILIPLAVGTIVLSRWTTLLFWGGAILLCGYEYFSMLRPAGYRPERAMGVGLIVALLLDVTFNWHAAAIILVLTVVLPVLWEFRRTDHQGFLNAWALTVLGVLYIGLLGSYLFVIRDGPNGTAILAFTLMAVWMADGIAFFVGRALGRHPFFQHISPKKTWEGAIGGVVGATVAFTFLMGIYGLGTGWNPLISLACGIGIGIASIAGDLAESLIKRQVNAKDSGDLLAGHGGVLDRLDSMFFTLVFAYYFLAIFGIS